MGHKKNSILSTDQYGDRVCVGQLIPLLLLMVFLHFIAGQLEFIFEFIFANVVVVVVKIIVKRDNLRQSVQFQ